MEDTAKYLIHADLVADGVVERSDVVGAVFGQTEGLLGDDLEIHDLQESSRLGRIDVKVESEGGQSFGRITIASSLDRVETAILAAALEAIERVGPCMARVEVVQIEDVRAAKRRRVVDRAKELLNSKFDEGTLDSADIVEEVRESIKVEDITEYEGLPAGPNVASSDAVVVVEGRADVKRLLRFGVKNAIAVEGTNVPDAVAALTREKHATAFLDGDRGGDLILRELAQVGDIDAVAHAPEGRSVEDLSREEVHAALRAKSPFEGVPEVAAADGSTAPDAESAPDGGAAESADGGTVADDATSDDVAGAVTPQQPSVPDEVESIDAPDSPDSPGASDAAGGDVSPSEAGDSTAVDVGESDDAAPDASASAEEKPRDQPVQSLGEVVAEVAGSGRAVCLDAGMESLADGPAEDAFDLVAETTPQIVVVDASIPQRLLDVAAQRGVGMVVGSDRGEYVKQPAGVRVHTHDEF